MLWLIIFTRSAWHLLTSSSVKRNGSNHPESLSTIPFAAHLKLNYNGSRVGVGCLSQGLYI